MPPLSFGSDSDQKLLKLIKDNPVLYNPRHPKYSNCDNRELTWQKIGDAMGKSTAEFAGIQCHIQFGEFQEDKHKLGFIENLSEYLPAQYCSSWGIEKKILKEYSKHVELNELEAKHLYTKTARALPTYGVTFFLVKEKQKGRKKLVPRLLGINADAILRLDETTKEILQQWPLTHVKTYFVGKGETFTLDFGDYSEKDYSVKTRHALRIRDILEGYIDLIRKRMLANYNQSQTEYGAISQENISSGQAGMMQFNNMSNSPMKIVEQSCVGPSRILEYEPGQKVTQGTQVVTVQQILTSDLINKQGQGVKSDVPIRKDMSIPFTRRLNRMNSNSVKVVTLLTEPSQAKIEDAQKIVDEMNADMPFIRDGVKETVANQTSEEEKRKLLDQLHNLEALLKSLSQSSKPGSVNTNEADDAAKQIADLTTQMYFSMDPKTKRRSRILSKSRTSFIADEATERNLRRASFIAASAAANHALDSAEELLAENYKGPSPDAKNVEELERSAVDKIGKINAAIAHYLLAHSDPENIDFGAAINSLNVIHELVPELAKDGQALGCARGGAVAAAARRLCAAAKHACALAAAPDAERLQEATAEYADVAGKLVFTFGRGSKARADKENEVVQLAKDAGAKTSLLLLSAQELVEQTAAAPDAASNAAAVDAAGARAAVAARDLLTQAELNALTISEPHCQSALTAASEALSSSAQHLAAAWKPLVEHPDRHENGEKLHNRTMDLAKALDRLRESYAHLEDIQDGSDAPKTDNEAQRLKFIKSVSRIGGNMQAAEHDLNKPVTSPVKADEAAEAELRLSQRLAQLNAAVASLLAATSDREHPDYGTAELAVQTINELMPEVVKDSKTTTANQDSVPRAAFLGNIRALCAAAGTICASAYGAAPPEELSDAVTNYTDTSGKLTYVVNKRANPDRESGIIQESTAACNEASLLLGGVQQLAVAVGGERGAELDDKGAALADAAQSLITTAQVTAASISDPRCQSALLSSVDKVSSSGKQLAESWAPLAQDPKQELRVQALKGALKQLEARLDKLRAACFVPEQEVQSTQECHPVEGQGLQEPLQQQKLRFVMTMKGAKERLALAQSDFDKPTMAAKGADVDKVQARLSLALGQLNAAVASLLAATADSENPDFVAAVTAANTIAELMPHVILDTKTVSACKEEPARAAMLAQVRELCAAGEGLCAGADGSRPQGLNDAVGRFTNASGKLVYVVSPRVDPVRDERIVNLSSGACGQASTLLPGVARLAAAVGGDRGRELDERGAAVADAANNMLQTAQITAPSMASKDCQDAFLSSVEKLSGAGQQLAASLAPLDNDPKHKQQSQALQQALQKLEEQLEALRQACTAPDDLKEHPQKQQKLQFIKSMQGAKARLGDAHKELNKPTKPVKGAGVEEVQQRLSQRLGQLNAAIAALLAATADREKPDYDAAEKAANTIADLMPHVIQDTKTVSACKEEPARAAMLAQVRELCAAGEGLCAGADGSRPQGLNDAVGRFTNASGKLVYVVSPRVDPVRDEQIIGLSTAAGGQASALLSGVARLAAAVGGDRGRELDERGGAVADAAQAMLQTAQITAPSMSSPYCQEALLSSVDKLSGAGQRLAASLVPLDNETRHKQQSQALKQALQQLEAQLEALKQACKAPEVVPSQSPKKQQKLQFIKTIEAAKARLGDAQKELNKPTKPAQGSDVEEVQRRLSERLGQLNAAIASLLAATADRDKPDCAAAEQAANTIADLMPRVIQDTKTLSACKEEPARAAMLAQVRELCAAGEGLCAGVCGNNAQGLNSAIAKFTDASGKLVYGVCPRADAQREDRIVNISTAAGGQASALLSGVARLAAAVGGDRGRELDERGGAVADAAQAMLQTAQITAPSISSSHCQEGLLSAVDELSGAGQQLVASLAPLNNDPKHKQQSEALQQALQRLEAQLEALRQACKAADIVNSQGPSQEQKLQFIETVQQSKGKWADAQKELNKPTAPAKGHDVDGLQRRLAERLAQLNAAVAALLSATADREKPQYAEAEKAVKIITDLLPHVVQDTKTVNACQEEPARAAVLAQLRELCAASEGLCNGSIGSNSEGLNDAVAKFTDASGKLVYGVCPRVNPHRENQIIGLSTAAGGQASALLSGVAQLAAAVGGGRGQELDKRGGVVADAAQAMLQAAQITAPSMSSPRCQEALISSVEQLSSSAHQLSSSLAPLLEDPKHSSQAKKLHQALQQLQAQLDALKKACTAPDTTPPSVAKKPQVPGTRASVAHAVPNRASTDLTQDFLDRTRYEECMAQNPPLPKSIPPTCPAVVGKVEKVKPAPPVRSTDTDQRQQQFAKLIDEAQRIVKENKTSLIKLSNQESGSGPALSQSEMMRKQVALQQNLALASVEVAHMVAARDDDKIDYTAASRSAKTLPLLMTSIVEDGKQLSDNVNDMARKAFLYDLLQLCDSSVSVCDAANADCQKLNEAAVEFGDRSAKLLYVVSNDVDSALEKEIISRAKAIGDSASRLAEDAVAASGTAGTSVREICNAGTACVDAAGKLVYTAKLTAPSIHETPCQDALVSSTEALSSKLKNFSNSWKPLSSDPQQAKTVKELTREAENLERILEGLRSDVKGGRIGKRREMEQLVVEDTPMRQLTVKILDDAKLYAEASDLPASQKIEYAAYADKLNNALRALDLANARCKKTPHDTNKRRELENAIQNLQMILLQSRPSRGEKGKSNIVDLRDFIEEVSTEAKNLSAITAAVKVPTGQDTQTVQEIKEKCATIENKAYNLMNVDSRTDLDSTFDDILEVDQFGQECDEIIKKINKDLKEMEDVKAKRLILSQILPLSESCNMLRFATKSGISTAAGAGLDSSLDDLDDIESRVISSLAPAPADGVVLRSKQPRPVGNSTAAINLCREVALSAGGVTPATVTAYIAEAAAKTDPANPEEKNRLLKHLYKLVHLLKTLTVTSSTRGATWQPLHGPDVAIITEQILQEIHNPESKFGVKAGESIVKVLNESDIAKLLIPSAPKILGDEKLQEDKLAQLAGKLNSMCGQVTLGVASPVSLGRSAHAAVDAALELDAIARGCRTRNPMQSKKVDEAAKEMSFATYNVLKSAECASQDPNNPNLRRKLAEACEMLNQCIDELVSRSSSAPALQLRCGALRRGAAAQLAGLAPRPPRAAAAASLAADLAHQREHLCKLQGAEALPRREFLRALDAAGAAVRRSTDCAANCAYYIAISELHKDIAKSGLVDVPQIQKTIESVQDSCMAIIGCTNIAQAKEEKEELTQRVRALSVALHAAAAAAPDAAPRRTLARAAATAADAAAELEKHLDDGGDMSQVTSKAVNLLEAVDVAHGMIEQCPLVPRVGDMSAETKASCDEIINNSKSLLTNTLALLKDVQSAPEDLETMTWVTYSTSRKKLLDAYDALLKSVQRNGHRAGILEKAPEEEKEKVKKSYLEIQVDLANRWLKSSVCKPEAKDLGQQAVRNVIDLARQMSEDLNGSDREEARNIITETEELLCQCSKKYDHGKNSVLMDRVKELKKSIQRGVVTRVVEDFIADEDPLADLDVLTDSETDEFQRKFILERKIASLLAQLGRVTKTARFVAGASQHLGVELTQCSEQTELLAPMLVKAAQQRIDNPDNTVIVENYKALLAKYAESISKVRDLCDRAVDPMDFVQAAGDTMQRMREDMSEHNNDAQKCAYASSAITRLANRVIRVSMASDAVRADPELRSALAAAQQRLRAAAPPPGARASRLPHWRDTTAEILNTTADVESALGGENIFKKQPTTANQHIYNGAVELHKAVAGWSSHDNEIVAVARRTAVLMARLSEYMETDKKEALIATSKSIVMESHEVAELAKKLANECTDIRIKTNLLQTCERIPTISGQLKMLTTVKGSSLGHQGSAEDKEAMDMLVGNAQSLMMSIQEVVKAAASASVKIMSQRGPRLRWVRKNFY